MSQSNKDLNGTNGAFVHLLLWLELLHFFFLTEVSEVNMKYYM